MAALLTNNASSTLASSITNVATTIVVATGEGALFPSASTGAGTYFYATLVDTSLNIEIVKCTNRSTDTLTVTRAQDGTTAQAFTAGDIIEVRPIAELWRERVDKAGDTMTGDLTMSGTGQIKVPSGTTGQRSGSPAAGMVRFNSTLNEFEGYDGTQWASIGGGGGIMSLNDQTTSASFTVPTGSNGISVGPITVASGHTVTVPSGSTWVVI